MLSKEWFSIITTTKCSISGPGRCPPPAWGRAANPRCRRALAPGGAVVVVAPADDDAAGAEHHGCAHQAATEELPSIQIHWVASISPGSIPLTPRLYRGGPRATGRTTACHPGVTRASPGLHRAFTPAWPEPGFEEDQGSTLGGQVRWNTGQGADRGRGVTMMDVRWAGRFRAGGRRSGRTPVGPGGLRRPGAVGPAPHGADGPAGCGRRHHHAGPRPTGPGAPHLPGMPPRWHRFPGPPPWM